MFALSRLSRWAAVGGLVILGGYSLPARADELAQNPGPVGPHEKSLKIECGDFADTLRFAASKLVTAGAAE
jgi:hypothetical protein